MEPGLEEMLNKFLFENVRNWQIIKDTTYKISLPQLIKTLNFSIVAAATNDKLTTQKEILISFMRSGKIFGEMGVTERDRIYQSSASKLACELNKDLYPPQAAQASTSSKRRKGPNTKTTKRKDTTAPPQNMYEKRKKKKQKKEESATTAPPPLPLSSPPPPPPTIFLISDTEMEEEEEEESSSPNIIIIPPLPTIRVTDVQRELNEYYANEVRLCEVCCCDDDVDDDEEQEHEPRYAVQFCQCRRESACENCELQYCYNCGSAHLTVDED